MYALGWLPDPALTLLFALSITESVIENHYLSCTCYLFQELLSFRIIDAADFILVIEIVNPAIMHSECEALSV
jgi:hypothetical protein